MITGRRLKFLKSTNPSFKNYSSAVQGNQGMRFLTLETFFVTDEAIDCNVSYLLSQYKHL